MQELEWCSDNADHGNTTYRRDAIDIRSSLLAVSRAKPKRAAKAISIILSDKRNKAFKQEMLNVLSPYNANRSLETLMIKGIRDSIAHHTMQRGGSRTLASETFIQNVCCACMFGDDSDNPFLGLQVKTILGINYRQLERARTKAQYLIKNSEIMESLDRDVRKDFIRVKLAPYVYSFLMDDSYTRLDTNQGLVEVVDPRSGKVVDEYKRI